MPDTVYVSYAVDGYLQQFDLVTKTLNLLPDPYIEDLTHGRAHLVIYPTLDHRITVSNPGEDEEVVPLEHLTIRSWESRRGNFPYFNFINENEPVQAWRNAWHSTGGAPRNGPISLRPLVLWSTIAGTALVTKVLDLAQFEQTAQINAEENQGHPGVRGAMAIAGAHGDLDAITAMLNDTDGYHDDDMEQKFNSLRSFLNGLGEVQENEGAQAALTSLNAISRWYRDADGEERMPEEQGIRHLEVIREFIILHMVDSVPAVTPTRGTLPAETIRYQAWSAYNHLQTFLGNYEDNFTDEERTLVRGRMQLIRPALELPTPQPTQPSPLAVVQDLDALLDLFRNDTEFDKQSLIDVLTEARRALETPAVREVEAARRDHEQPPAVTQALEAMNEISDVLRNRGLLGPDNRRNVHKVFSLLRYWQTAISEDVARDSNANRDQERTGFQEVVAALQNAGFEVTPLAGERNT